MHKRKKNTLHIPTILFTLYRGDLAYNFAFTLAY